MNESEKPRLIVVAGPNGAGKTSITEQYDVPISKIIDRYARSLANCQAAARLVDRAYVYDNSIENASARLIFRTTDGGLVKTYGTINPWARAILREI